MSGRQHSEQRAGARKIGRVGAFSPDVAAKAKKILKPASP